MARRVRESGEREELAPMTPFERKIVHDAVAAVDIHLSPEDIQLLKEPYRPHPILGHS